MKLRVSLVSDFPGREALESVSQALRNHGFDVYVRRLPLLPNCPPATFEYFEKTMTTKAESTRMDVILLWYTFTRTSVPTIEFYADIYRQLLDRLLTYTPADKVAVVLSCPANLRDNGEYGELRTVMTERFIATLDLTLNPMFVGNGWPCRHTTPFFGTVVCNFVARTIKRQCQEECHRYYEAREPEYRHGPVFRRRRQHRHLGPYRRERYEEEREEHVREVLRALNNIVVI